MVPERPILEVRVLGTLDVRPRGGVPVQSVLAQPKRMAVLAYLACARPHGLQQRDKLIALFWPEMSTERARKALRQSLYHLRAALGPDALVTIGDSEVGVSSEYVWCDQAAMVRLLQKDAAKACELYRGELLPGFHIDEAPAFEEWLEAERAWLRRQAVDMATRLAKQSHDAGSTATAIDWARRAAIWQPGEEQLLRNLMELLVAAGDRAAALREYNEFEARLQREFDLAPSAATRSYAEALRSAEPVPVTVAPRAEASTAGTAGTATNTPLVPHGISRTFLYRAAAIVGLISIAALMARSARQVRAERDGNAATESRACGAQAILPALAKQRNAASVLIHPFTGADSTSAMSAVLRGMQHQVHSSLAGIKSVELVGPGTAELLAACGHSPIELARQFGVATVLSGQVFPERSNGWLNVSLVDADGGRTLWAASFDRDTTPDQLLKIQADITTNVARRLRVDISDALRTYLSTSPTASSAAYYHYLTGQVQISRFNYKNAAVEFDQAISEDSTFGEAWAGLSMATSLMRYASGRADPHAQRARFALMKAEELNPAAIDTRIAAGLVQLYLEYDFDAAFEMLRAIRTERPADPRLPMWMAVARLLQQRLSEAGALADSTLMLDRTDLEANKLAGWLHASDWRFARAREELMLAHALAPSDSILTAWLFEVHINGFGDTTAARTLMESLPASQHGAFQGTLALFRRDAAAAAAAARSNSERLGRLSRIHYAKGRSAEARLFADSLLLELAPNLETIDRATVDPLAHARVLARVAIAEALRGNAQRARATIGRAVRISADSPDMMNKAVIRISELRVYALLGDADKAAPVMEALFTKRAQGGFRLKDITPHLVMLDPDFDRIRERWQVQRVLRRFRMPDMSQ